MLSRLHKDNRGFSIIEVLIVLAIAALIMLVVFLAVPALQRNSRNSATRTEANNLLAAYQEIFTNKGGPTAGLTTTDVAAVTGAANIKSITTVTISTTAPTAATTNANLVPNASCSAQDAHTTTAKSRSVAIQFFVETSGGTQAQCMSS